MYGWQARPCTNLHGMYRWFDIVPQGGDVFFPSFFVVIFRALCWRCFEDVFLGFLVGVTYEELVRLLLVNRTRFGVFSSWASSCSKEAISSIPLDCERLGSIHLR
jgi:hypothetical protein